MNPLVLLAGVGVMVALAGLVLGAAGLAGVGTGRPARLARKRTASGYERFSISIMKLITVPPLPQPKQ